MNTMDRSFTSRGILTLWAFLLGALLLFSCPISAMAMGWGTVEGWDEDEKWDEEELMEVWPDSVTASSYLKEAGFDHSPYNLLDYDEESDWAEGVSHSGAGEYVDFTFPKGTTLTGFSILPGYYKTKRLFFQNGAPDKVNLRMGSFTENFDLTRYASEYGILDSEGIFFPFASPIVVDGPIRLMILSVREGDTYGDCCISEVHFFSESEDSFEAVRNWKLDKAQSLTKEQMDHLVSFAYNLYRFRRNDKAPKKGKMTSDSLSAEEMCYGLYWYQSQKFDDRVWTSPRWWYNAAYTRDLETMFYELYEGPSAETWDAFEDSYILWQDGEVSYVDNGGEFSTAGSFVFRSYQSRGLVEGALVIRGDVCVYNSEKNRYVASKTFQATFIPTKAKTLHGWRFEKLEIS